MEILERLSQYFPFSYELIVVQTIFLTGLKVWSVLATTFKPLVLNTASIF